MINQYRYSIYLKYMYNNKEILLDGTMLKAIAIDYSYDTRHMPIILITALIDKNIVDDMIKSVDKKTITLSISKYINNSNMKLKEDYIKDQFRYYLSTNDLNPEDDLDYSKETANSKDIYRKITIGLLKDELIQNNKVLINDVISNTSLINVLVNHLSHMKLLIEPVNNTIINRLSIPALNTISKFVQYIDDNYNIYNNEYRLFYDFDMTYLLSSSGKAIQSIKEDITSIIVRVNNNTGPNNGIQGMEIDAKQKAYIIEVPTNDINYNEDKATHVSYDTIIGIDSSGNYKKTALKDNASGSRVRIERTPNGNLDNIETLKSSINNKSFVINLTKSHIDTSVFTINKEYHIKNYDKLKDKDGRFLLARKREIYTQDNGEFILTCVLSFRKAIS